MKLSQLFSKITLSKIVIVLSLVALSMFVFALLVPISPSDIKVIKVQDSYIAGQSLDYNVTRCRNVDAPLGGYVSRSLVNVDGKSSAISLGSTNPSNSGRGCGDIPRNVPIPNGTPTGNYKLQIETHYSISVLFVTRQLPTHTYESDVFHIEGVK